MSYEPHILRILLVEDNEDDYVLTAGILPESSYHVTWAQSLTEAKQLVQQHQFDVLLVDMGLPDSEGIGTYDQIVQSTATIPAVIVLTGNDDIELAKESLLRGAQDYLVKGPRLNAELLKRSITYAVERYKVESRLRVVNNELNELNKTLKDTNEQLTDARDKAIESNRLKTEFLANISHEIRTPLSGVASVADLLNGIECPPNVTELHKLLLTSSRHLLRVVNDILNISKLEVGRMTAVYGNCDLREALADATSTAKPIADSKKLDLRCEIDESVPSVIFSDEVKLRQILLHLTQNAVKFTEHGSVKLSAHVRDKHLIVKVQDTGIGIPADQLEKVFEPFFQVDGSLTRKHDGTGIGLTIVKKNAALLGVKVHCSSEQGKGSTFEFSLPIERT